MICIGLAVITISMLNMLEPEVIGSVANSFSCITSGLALVKAFEQDMQKPKNNNIRTTNQKKKTKKNNRNKNKKKRK